MVEGKGEGLKSRGTEEVVYLPRKPSAIVIAGVIIHSRRSGGQEG